MSEVKVNKISPRTNCGTVTLGDSGDSFTIPSGVTITNNGTQTGFGRTGAVDWQTSIQTSASFTAVNGQGFFIDTSSNAITANLPAGTAGSIVAFADYARNFATNNFTITPNGSQKIGGNASSAVLNVNGQASTFVYADDTKGWVNVQNAEDTETGATFISATGGTVTTVCTNFKVHTFTGPGTFCVSSVGNAAGSESVDYLVVAGGGAGGYANGGGGGGGAGGLRYTASTYCNPSPSGGAASTALPVSVQGYPITVGAGGGAKSGSPDYKRGCSGSNSIFSTITSTGGGGGGGATCGSNGTGSDGGSGGGGGKAATAVAGGSGNTPPVGPPQGNPGGTGGGPSVLNNRGGGGGGHAQTGNAAVPAGGGAGGNGSVVAINGSCTAYAGGGGGNSENNPVQGAGGTGGGGAAGAPGSSGNAGSTNTGGGGGGVDSSPSGQQSGAGGSGIVIIRYKFQ